MAALLLTTFGTAACSIDRTKSAGLDPAVTDDCPREVHAPGDLPERTPFQLDDGRWVVPIEEANARENMLVAGALVYRSAYQSCRSVVIYAEQRDAGLAK